MQSYATMTDTEVMREIIEFSGHKFVIRLDGQQVVALVATIELACRHPNFHGPTRLIAEMLATSLKRIATQQAPDLDLLQSVFSLGWIPDPGTPANRTTVVP